MKPVNILVIDDDEVMTFLFGRAITSHSLNCAFRCTTSAEAALKYLEETTEFPDVILLDYHLPKMDGFDFLLEYEKAKYHEKHHPLLFMISSYSRKDLSQPLSEFTFVEGFIDKPFSPLQLRNLLVHYFPDVNTAPASQAVKPQ